MKEINWPGNVAGSENNITNDSNTGKELLVDNTQIPLCIINSEASRNHAEVRVCY